MCMYIVCGSVYIAGWVVSIYCSMRSYVYRRGVVWIWLTRSPSPRMSEIHTTHPPIYRTAYNIHTHDPPSYILRTALTYIGGWVVSMCIVCGPMYIAGWVVCMYIIRGSIYIEGWVVWIWVTFSPSPRMSHIHTTHPPIYRIAYNIHTYDPPSYIQDRI